MTTQLHQARALFEQGVQAFESGQLPQAEACFAKALELAPERPSVLMNLGVVKAALGQTTQAIDLLLRSAELEPEARLFDASRLFAEPRVDVDDVDHAREPVCLAIHARGLSLCVIAWED